MQLLTFLFFKHPILYAVGFEHETRIWSPLLFCFSQLLHLWVRLLWPSASPVAHLLPSPLNVRERKQTSPVGLVKSWPTRTRWQPSKSEMSYCRFWTLCAVLPVCLLVSLPWGASIRLTFSTFRCVEFAGGTETRIVQSQSSILVSVELALSQPAPPADPVPLIAEALWQRSRTGWDAAQLAGMASAVARMLPSATSTAPAELASGALALLLEEWGLLRTTWASCCWS